MPVQDSSAGGVVFLRVAVFWAVLVDVFRAVVVFFAADDVDTLIVQGANVTVYARDINHLQIQGAGVTVHWLGDDPDIQDQGAGSTTGKISQ